MKKVFANLIVLVLFGGVLVWIGCFIYGIISAVAEDSKNYPGKKEFAVENDKISVFQNTVDFGNTPDALKIATDFSGMLQAEAQVAFSGGSKLTPATAGHFLTNCVVTPKSVVILCQVPDLRGYRDDVRDALAKLAWSTAQIAAKSNKVTEDSNLIVGLRGFGSYGPIWEGKVAGEPKSKADDPSNGVTHLYPYFAPTNADK